MAETLGILVTSDKHLDYVISLTCEAYQKGKTVQIFFTGAAVRLTRLPVFEQLVGKAKLSVCETSYRFRHLADRVSGIGPDNFETQARNADLMKNCDKYVVF